MTVTKDRRGRPLRSPRAPPMKSRCSRCGQEFDDNDQLTSIERHYHEQHPGEKVSISTRD